MLERHDLVHAATAAARQAAGHIRAAAGAIAPRGADRKGPRDFVTAVDREAERLIAEELRQVTPEAPILGEELSPETVPHGVAWIVDPLDGTANFLHEYPWYAVSIAAVQDGRLEAAVVVNVPSDTLYTAAAGAGAWVDGRRLAVSTIEEPELALIGTGFPFRTPQLVPRYLRQFCNINAAVSGIRRAGSASLDLVDVACGRFDGFWELSLAPWDVAAGSLIAREAGGIVTSLAGTSDVLRHGGIVAGNPTIHRWLINLVGERHE